MRKAAAALLMSLIVLTACSRGVAIESEPGPVYVVGVENPMSHAMDVWFDDGVQTAELGRVDARSTREFVIAAPASSVVEIIARDDGRTHTVTRRVQLTSGGASVVLTP
ncbi:MAG TPA: hypothetical protein VMN78_09615 [Longimicrobiales bacterium]|nr:hypothetical protein [Longimicrobiales bacterium]